MNLNIIVLMTVSIQYCIHTVSMNVLKVILLICLRMWIYMVLGIEKLLALTCPNSISHSETYTFKYWIKIFKLTNTYLLYFLKRITFMKFEFNVELKRSYSPKIRFLTKDPSKHCLLAWCMLQHAANSFITLHDNALFSSSCSLYMDGCSLSSPWDQDGPYVFVCWKHVCTVHM